MDPINKLTAFRHGLTGQVLVMSAKDRAAYECHTQTFLDEHKPKGIVEAHLVQFLIDDAWRFNHSVAIRARLLSSAFAQADNINLSRKRLTRQFERTLRLLRKIQAERRRDEKRQLAKATKILKMPITHKPC